MIENTNHQENNEIMIAETKRENAVLGKEASLAILAKINNSLNNLYSLLKGIDRR